jgi:ribosomal protein L6P/L9E
MKLLEVSRTLPIPAGVTVEVKGRCVRVKGPRGTLQRACACVFVMWDGAGGGSLNQ